MKLIKSYLKNETIKNLHYSTLNIHKNIFQLIIINFYNNYNNLELRSNMYLLVIISLYAHHNNIIFKLLFPLLQVYYLNSYSLNFNI